MAKPPSITSSARLLILIPIILYMLIFLLHGIARGEEPKEGKVILSLPEIINMAISKSPEVGEVRSEISGTKSDLEQVEAAYYPQLESMALAGPVQKAKEPLIVNGRITDPSPSLSTSGITVFGRLDLTMTQPLYTFGKLSNRKEAAGRGIKAKESQLVEKKAQIVLRVKELYYALVLARSGVAAADEAANFFDEAGRRMNRLLELGSSNVKESDLYRIDAYRADTLRSRAEAEKGARVAYFALKSLIQMPPGVDFEPAEKTLSLRKEDLASLESYIQQARSERPEFKQLAEALAAQESQVKAATSDRYPSFFAAVKGSLAGAPGRDTLYNRYFTDEFNHTYAGVVTGIKWNFDFGISKAKVDKMRAEYEKLIHTKALAEINIPIQVTKSYQEHLEWRTAADSYQKATNASRKWILAALTDFDMGVGTADEMLRAIEKYGQNRGKFLEALFHYNLSLAELEYAVGLKTW